MRLRKSSEGPMEIRRRYTCRLCEHRWSTLERIIALSAGEPSEISKLPFEDKKRLAGYIANKLQHIAYKIRVGKL